MFRVPDELAYRLRVEAAQRRITMQQLLIDAVTAHLAAESTGHLRKAEKRTLARVAGDQAAGR